METMVLLCWGELPSSPSPSPSPISSSIISISLMGSDTSLHTHCLLLSLICKKRGWEKSSCDIPCLSLGGFCHEKVEISSPSSSERSRLPPYELWLCWAKLLVFCPVTLDLSLMFWVCPCGGFGEKAGIVPVLRLINGTVLSAF